MAGLEILEIVKLVNRVLDVVHQLRHFGGNGKNIIYRFCTFDNRSVYLKPTCYECVFVLLSD